MRKIVNLRRESDSRIRCASIGRFFPVFLIAVLVILSLIGVTASEMTESSDLVGEKYDNVSELSEGKDDFSGELLQRAEVKVIYGGEEYATCNFPIVTVGELLSKVGITLGENDVLYCDENEMISDGMEIKVGVVTHKTYTEEIEIAFDTIYEESQTIPKGKTELVTAGKNGIRNVTYKGEFVDGVEVTSEKLSDEVTVEPVNAVYYKGVGGTVTSNDGTVYNYSYYIDVVATAYHTGGITATGHVANEEVVAVDPKVIPYGTKMFITGNWGEIGYRSAEDCGNFKGNHIDVCMEGTRAELLQFGRRQMRVYILE